MRGMCSPFVVSLVCQYEQTRGAKVARTSGKPGSSVTSDALEKPRAELRELLLAEPAHAAEIRERAWLRARELAKRRVMENHVGGNGALRGDLAPQRAQAFEELLVDAFPRRLLERSLLDLRLLRLDE